MLTECMAAPTRLVLTNTAVLICNRNFTIQIVEMSGKHSQVESRPVSNKLSIDRASRSLAIAVITIVRFDYDKTTIRRYHDAFDYDESDRN